MNDIILKDAAGNTYNANVLFTHHSLEYNKDYVIYSVGDDLLVSSYENNNGEMIIKNDLTDIEYDMIDKIIALRMEALDE